MEPKRKSVKTDDKAKLCEKYSVAAVPTVFLFEKGQSGKTARWKAGIGLDEKHFKKLVNER